MRMNNSVTLVTLCHTLIAGTDQMTDDKSVQSFQDIFKKIEGARQFYARSLSKMYQKMKNHKREN